MRLFLVGLIILLSITLLSKLAVASPFLVSDPHPQADEFDIYYEIDGIEAATVEVQAQSDSSLKYDVGPIAYGQYVLQIRACSPLWGCSENASFAFNRPVSVNGVGSIRLIK